MKGASSSFRPPRPSAAAAAAGTVPAEGVTYPADVDSMEIDDPAAFGLMDPMDAPTETVDTEFFNGAQPRRCDTLRIPRRHPPPQTSRTTLTTRTSTDPGGTGCVILFGFAARRSTGVKQRLSGVRRRRIYCGYGLRCTLPESDGTGGKRGA